MGIPVRRETSEILSAAGSRNKFLLSVFTLSQKAGSVKLAELIADRYTKKSGLETTGLNFQTYLYAPLKKSIVIS